MTQLSKPVAFTDQDVLDLHAKDPAGKISVVPTKPLVTARDLSLAYSPGVAIPCIAIQKNPALAYEYTAKGNLVAVISNGTAVLGLGKLGPLASKPVMEGKAALFKRFADIDSMDIEVDTTDPEAFVNAIRYLGPTWGGINLEDIAAPACFIIEEKLKSLMDIPVFHDDQHGTAIAILAGLINAAQITKRDFKQMKIVLNGAGAAGIALLNLLKLYGQKNVTVLDTSGVIYQGRAHNMNPWKEAFAVSTKARTITDATQEADVFIGLSVANVLSAAPLKQMAKNPIIFALANPDPEIWPTTAKDIRSDVIIATGRSDFPNQINNSVVFPYVFRGALDVRASTINEAMKLAAVEALAALPKEPIPQAVKVTCGNQDMVYGPDYIIPNMFDPRLIYKVAPAVAAAAMKSGVAQKPIEDIEAYKKALMKRLSS